MSRSEVQASIENRDRIPGLNLGQSIVIKAWQDSEFKVDTYLCKQHYYVTLSNFVSCIFLLKIILLFQIILKVENKYIFMLMNNNYYNNFLLCQLHGDNFFFVWEFVFFLGVYPMEFMKSIGLITAALGENSLGQFEIFLL